MSRTLRRHGTAAAAAWTAAALAWAAEVATVTGYHGRMADQPLVTAFTVCVTFLAIHLSVPGQGRPRAGQRMVSDEEYHASEMALTRAVMAGLPDSQRPGGHVKTVSGLQAG